MISIKEIEKLAELARIDLNEKEKKHLQENIGAILDYVKKLKEAPVENLEELTRAVGNANEMREDNNSYKPGEFSEMILNQAPSKENGYLKVKKVI
ncbi:MAG: hypothetical protein A2909_02100 [Candidatus Tagabacteria bacterium RIFCSPLOWO2_01_FULL_39_11]|uniref:Aspartyl/glutamyl-tRNA(Asn/Gln) amidotransferase subunit C n=1 Tax=Candidatus Tagabacteria bacterium RIFCSPLOWO2_01_FULL_39_11 TaxID=1802295 RepID=A0A1G2LPX0_9BACT|nr:MAG: hypothetical protein A2909_02100 [Candidatus Tagabacteria bacterium RIFCSPLOWO2_01_FULL_39_11]